MSKHINGSADLAGGGGGGRGRGGGGGGVEKSQNGMVGGEMGELRTAEKGRNWMAGFYILLTSPIISVFLPPNSGG
jgi:hypothetical protein